MTQTMRKKPSKRTIIKKLDKEWSRVIRLRERCARCSTSENLQAAHIFSRRSLSVRWDLDNGIPLCYACHMFWAHKEPIYFTDLAKEYLGEVKFLALRLRATAIKKWSVEEMQELLDTLNHMGNG